DRRRRPAKAELEALRGAAAARLDPLREAVKLALKNQLQITHSRPRRRAQLAPLCHPTEGAAAIALFREETVSELDRRGGGEVEGQGAPGPGLGHDRQHGHRVSERTDSIAASAVTYAAIRPRSWGVHASRHRERGE